ncbi:MAG: DUF6527 family protein [Desulfitobacterium sp.]
MRARLMSYKVGEKIRNEVYLWCPGCDGYHSICVDHGGWTWNGNEENPTISPSILVRGVRGDDDQLKTLCHSFVRDGKIQFLSDSAHALAGQTVELPDIED